jgi:hypothetical protein
VSQQSQLTGGMGEQPMTGVPLHMTCKSGHWLPKQKQNKNKKENKSENKKKNKNEKQNQKTKS